MNELIFFLHIIVVLGFALLCLRLGKSSLITFIALQGIFANLFVVKQMALFSFDVTCSDVFAIGAIFSLNLLQEYFGKEAAKKAIQVSLATLLFFAISSQIHLSYHPSTFDQTQGAFQTIFSPSFRLVAASITSFYLVQQFDYRLFAKLKGSFVKRVSLSLFLSQLLDTVLFSFLGLYGLVHSLFDIIFLSFFVKCLIICTSSFFTLFIKKLVKHEVSL